MNSNSEVTVLFTSQVGFRNKTTLPIIDALLSYSNVRFNYLNLIQYAKKTPLEKWMKSGELFRSQFVNSHTSDVLRFLTLWIFGGTYMDLDTITMKSLDTLEPNFAGAGSKDFITAAVINVENSLGLEIADKFIEGLLEDFDANDWVKLGS